MIKLDIQLFLFESCWVPNKNRLRNIAIMEKDKFQIYFRPVDKKPLIVRILF